MKFASLLLFSAAASAQIPVGLDAYRMWDRWPYQRIGVRAYMRSTYDRSGGNERADASHFLYQLAEDRNVTLDVEGPGELYFVRYNHWHGSPWHYEVDGADHLVRETSTLDPEHPAEGSVFEPQSAFPKPLAALHVVQTSNRRFRDDEFLRPLALTKGRSSIRVRVKFTPVETPLYPGYPLPELAWSEMRYTAYSYVTPRL
jgi:hypothetical protein